MKRNIGFLLLSLCLVVFLTACGGASSSSADEVRLVLAAYTTPREAYGEIIPRFQDYWLSETGQKVVFEESYLGSGAQSRAVVEGFEADIVALSLEADVTRIQNAGLITHEWKAGEFKGIVTTSIVAFAVRQGNPKNVQDWPDLAKPGIEVLTPNPNMSGGAMWNILGLYGAALRGHINGVPADDHAAASEFLRQVLTNVSVMDKSARESILNYEMGIGDLAITYENEVLVGRNSGQNYELVIPTSTILIENPIAVVDVNVDRHGSREVAEAFVKFLYGREAQDIFARHGLRVVNPEAAAASAALYPQVEDLFTIDYFGGWEAVMVDYFGPEGIYNAVIMQVHRGE
ncbi:MAG: sulfate ABC transporter substrate-binding protein [Brevefilum sp.]|nr:sulfate ABC transporter substrate-binding protein [Brevefilum sp.]